MGFKRTVGNAVVVGIISAMSIVAGLSTTPVEASTVRNLTYVLPAAGAAKAMDVDTSLEANVPETVLNPVYLTDEEAYMLAKLAMAEAEGEDTEGKALVITVVINRTRSGKFPESIKEVIHQDKQFSCMDDGRYNKVEPSQDCWEALTMVENGWDESNGALYFEKTSPDSWQTRNLTYLFTHQDHSFYTQEDNR